MGMFFLPKASFKMGTFSDPKHTNPGFLILEWTPGTGHMLLDLSVVHYWS